MHTLLLLTAVLSSLGPAVDFPTPARLELSPALTRPASQRETLHLLDTRLHEEEDSAGTAGRVIVEYLAGLGTGVATLTMGVLLYPGDMPDAVLIGSLSLYALGNSIGVTLAGSAMDGRGRFGYALLGSLVGLVVPIGAGVAMIMSDSDCTSYSRVGCSAVVPMVVGILLLPTLGAVIGFEASAPTPWLSLEYASRTPPPPPRFVPVLTLAREGVGGTLGIAGSL